MPQSAVINCPETAKCNIDCTVGGNVCYNASINWLGPTGSGSLSCGSFPYNAKCQSVTFPTPDPDTPLTITCRYFRQCAYSTLICPDNADCIIKCSGHKSCEGTFLF